MRDELRKIFPELTEEELEESEYNLKGYARVLARMIVSMHREEKQRNGEDYL